MNARAESHRAVAELPWEEAEAAVPRVGGRSLHQFWPVLAPYFRDLLLPPLRRPEASVVTWAWREPAGARAATAAELRGLRTRLAREQELLTENLARAQDASGGGMTGLAAAMDAVIERLIASDDGALARYVCRTEAGLRLHSWGARRPGRIQYPDTPAAVEAEKENGERGEASGDVRRRRRRGAVFWIVGATIVAAVLVGVWTRGPESAADDVAAREDGSAGDVGAKEVRPRDAEAEELTTSARRVEVSAPKAVAEGGRAAPGWMSRTESRNGALASGVDEVSAAAAGVEIVNGVQSAKHGKRPAVEEAEVIPLPAAPKGRPHGTGKGSATRSEGAIEESDSKGTERLGGEKAEVLRARGKEERSTSAEMPRTKIERRVDGEDAAIEGAGNRAEHSAEMLEEAEALTTESVSRLTLSRLGAADVVEDRSVAQASERNDSGAGWSRMIVVRRPRWGVRLLGDAIVPTLPVRRGAEDRAGALRAQVVDEFRKRMPATLREPRLRGGIGFEVNGETERAQLRWRRFEAGVVVETRVADGIELGWDELRRTGDVRWVLERVGADVLAEMRTVDGESATVALGAGVRAYLWCAGRVAPGEGESRFGWRPATEGALPPGWRVWHGVGGGESRIEVPLDEASAGARETLAWFDRATGWAVVTGLERLSVPAHDFERPK